MEHENDLLHGTNEAETRLKREPHQKASEFISYPSAVASPSGHGEQYSESGRKHSKED